MGVMSSIAVASTVLSAGGSFLSGKSAKKEASRSRKSQADINRWDYGLTDEQKALYESYFFPDELSALGSKAFGMGKTGLDQQFEGIKQQYTQSMQARGITPGEGIYQSGLDDLYKQYTKGIMGLGLAGDDELRKRMELFGSLRGNPSYTPTPSTGNWLGSTLTDIGGAGMNIAANYFGKLDPNAPATSTLSPSTTSFQPSFQPSFYGGEAGYGLNQFK